MTPLGIRVRSVGALSLAGALVLSLGVPASAQLTAEEFCAAIAAEPGAEGATSSPAVDAAASPAMEAASPPADAGASPAPDAAASPAAEGSGMAGMSPETTALLVELCTRAGLGAAASSDGEASAAPMESPAASIAAEASPAAG
jgi:hypothetical protein